MRALRYKLKPSELIKELRQKKCWTQEKLSQSAGISVGALSKLENGQIAVTKVYAGCIAKALRVKMSLII